MTFAGHDDNVAAAYLSPRDMNQLLARALLGYDPQDDGFRAREERAARAGAA